MITKSEIQQMADTIVERFDPEKVILFGSYARGEIPEDSGVDLIVIKETERNIRELAAEIGVAVWQFPVAKDILVRTPAQFKRECTVNWTVFHEADLEEEVLYERSA